MDRIITFLLHDSTLDNQSMLSRNQQFLFNIEQSIIVLHFISMRFCRMIEFTYQKKQNALAEPESHSFPYGILFEKFPTHDFAPLL